MAEDPHAKLMALLDAEPRPITGERVLQLASTLGGTMAQQFRAWFKSSGPTLLEKLNG